MAKKKAAAEQPKQVQAQPAATPQPSAHGVTRPRSGTATGRVWEIADELSAQAKQPAARADVLKAFESEGGNPATGATQYGRWKKFHGLGRAQAAQDAGSEDAPEVES
jgi:hypothetical protein